MHKLTKDKRIIRRKLKKTQKCAIEKGIDRALIRHFYYVNNIKEKSLILGLNAAILSVGAALILVAISSLAVEYLLSARCLLPINHLVWEATRPLADCNYCANVTKPIILQNITRQNFRVGKIYSTKFYQYIVFFKYLILILFSI